LPLLISGGTTMSDILSKLFIPEDCRRVLCAVSGGADSVALLHLLSRLRDEGRLELYAAHFEHGIRGEESLRDEAFVKSFCEKIANYTKFFSPLILPPKCDMLIA